MQKYRSTGARPSSAVCGRCPAYQTSAWRIAKSQSVEDSEHGPALRAKGSSVNSLSPYSVNADYPLVELSRVGWCISFAVAAELVDAARKG